MVDTKTRTAKTYTCILVVGVCYPPGQKVETEKEILRYLSGGLDSFLRDHPV